MKVRARPQAVLLRSAVLVLLCLLCSCRFLPGYKRIAAKYLAEVSKAGRELDRTGNELQAARGKLEQAQAGLKYVDDQIWGAQDLATGDWWSSQRRDKIRELHDAKILVQQAEVGHVASGRKYWAAESAYKKFTGSYNDPKLAAYWGKTLAEMAAQSSAKEPLHEETKEWRDRLVLFSLGFLGLCLLMVLALTKKRWIRLVRKAGIGSDLPQITVRKAAPPPKPKEQPPLAGKYKLDIVIGHGGMGRVWVGEHLATHEQVAVKQMAEIKGVDRYAVRELYKREARSLENLHHPNIVKLLEAVDVDDGLYLVFEFVRGKTLQQLLAERKRLTWKDVCGIFVPVAKALGYAHGKGVIHRDIKPQNIMVTEAGQVKVMDFGIARTIGGPGDATAQPFSLAPGSAAGQPPAVQGETAQPSEPPKSGTASGLEPMEMMTAKTKTMAGTPSYMCPEASKGIVSPGYDIFALGVCLYECLTGSLPFGYGGWSPGAAIRYIPPAVLVTGLDRRVDAVLAGMLEADLAKRIPSCEELIRRMQEIPL